MEIHFEGDAEECRATVKKSSEGSYVQKDAVLLEYKSSDGTRRRLGQGAIDREKSKNAPMRSSSRTCVQLVEKDLRQRGGRAGERLESSSANVSMIHHVPELIVSDKLAKEIGSQDENNLLATRKLVLLVDLDQTIIHTTNRPMKLDKKKHSDIVRYELMGGRYMTKLRPNTTNFLQKLSALYEMHIVTFGQRQYAHRIAEILDPNQKIFGHRILSRDELFSPQHKTRNLQALFPCGDNLVVIIDDRADVWQYSDALVLIKPYRFFKEVGDINAPSAARGKEQTLPVEIEDEAHKDNILEEMEKVLTNIHCKYYELHDAKPSSDPLYDVKSVINRERRKILDGVNIVMSGIVPVGEAMENTEAYRLAVQFGAAVAATVSPSVTHVVAARWGTNKVYAAKKLGIHVVSVFWLYACVEKWAKVEEEAFEMTEDTVAPKGRPLGSKFIDLANVSTIGKNAIADMNSEVDEALSEDDEDEEEDDEPSSSGESSKPVAIKHKTDDGDEAESAKRRKHAPEEEYESSPEESDDDNEPPMSYRKLVSKSKREGRMVEQEEKLEVEEFAPKTSGNEEDSEEEAKEDVESDDVSGGSTEDEDDEEMDSMAALIERQISGVEDPS
ncbi:unnamed protein product [Caenorhabditis auriculariae]|uniref:RNA polymerase II subunit A C-terminal domain phosphatase n=1 Tax=Caenorhabditis auriculariae TaxID=2777116 RepID=A0A8S1GQ56_9PELO|nr:unnamed protein product [Caenorhabditis auriculariae]